MPNALRHEFVPDVAPFTGRPGQPPRPLRRVREDALPEFTRYRDDGCDIHPACLTCPLPRCRYDEPGGVRTLLNAYRDRQILRIRQQGAPVDELARRFGVSRRTVFRVLARTNHRGHQMMNGSTGPTMKGADNGHR